MSWYWRRPLRPIRPRGACRRTTRSLTCGRRVTRSPGEWTRRRSPEAETPLLTCTLIGAALGLVTFAVLSAAPDPVGTDREHGIAWTPPCRESARRDIDVTDLRQTPHATFLNPRTTVASRSSNQPAPAAFLGGGLVHRRVFGS